MTEKDQEREKDKVDALCSECGDSFKKYMDRVANDGTKSYLAEKVDCPVCGCGQCDVIRPGTRVSKSRLRAQENGNPMQDVQGQRESRLEAVWVSKRTGLEDISGDVTFSLPVASQTFSELVFGHVQSSVCCRTNHLCLFQ